MTLGESFPWSDYDSGKQMDQMERIHSFKGYSEEGRVKRGGKMVFSADTTCSMLGELHVLQFEERGLQMVFQKKPWFYTLILRSSNGQEIFHIYKVIVIESTSGLTMGDVQSVISNIYLRVIILNAQEFGKYLPDEKQMNYTPLIILISYQEHGYSYKIKTLNFVLSNTKLIKNDDTQLIKYNEVGSQSEIKLSTNNLFLLDEPSSLTKSFCHSTNHVIMSLPLFSCASVAYLEYMSQHRCSLATCLHLLKGHEHNGVRQIHLCFHEETSTAASSHSKEHNVLFSYEIGFSNLLPQHAEATSDNSSPNSFGLYASAQPLADQKNRNPSYNSGLSSRKTVRGPSSNSGNKKQGQIMVPGISKSNLDFFDEDNEDAPSSPPYFDINTKILDEYKISTQDKIERFFQLVKVPLNYSVDKIVSLTVRNTMTTMQHRGVLRMYRAGKPSWIARPIGKLWGATVCKMHGVLLTRGRMSKQKRLRNLWHLSDRLRKTNLAPKKQNKKILIAVTIHEYTLCFTNQGASVTNAKTLLRIKNIRQSNGRKGKFNKYPQDYNV
ncbi:unnamed protein product [Lepeophtheirus salmonis]|uniref:(salmon louse) hypothetical protein n=1 Tax=Lepeophtheirus salmonis TaxID=72036 RepID=A0A817FC38_LEPSM|nr:unnamed protein product [Lepeophtheirus salmonis]